MHLFLSVVGTVPKKKEESDSDDDALSTGFSGAKGRGLKRGKKPAKKKGRPPQGKKRKISLNRSLSDPTLAISEPISIDSLPAGEGIDVSALAPGPIPTSSSVVPAPANPKAAEASPFETVPTFKCNFCPKRSQNRERIQRHLASEHPDKADQPEEITVKVLTRDQVVDFLTLNLAPTSTSSCSLYKCFYCDVDFVGSILEVQGHFDSAHPQERLKVKTFTGKATGGYLECQICGHLTPGLERSPQKMHFHEEHPFETVVNASKYISKVKGQTAAPAAAPPDLSRFIGSVMRCPRPECDFEAKTLSAVNSHLRRHTLTFKCGHCGKTHSNSSEFHQHSAMSHGDKIPDLVKDPEAEAEFEALRALFEHSLVGGNVDQVKENDEVPRGNEQSKRSKPTARKSTASGKKERNFARKSTGVARREMEVEEGEEFSFYRQELDVVDLSAISTRMNCGGVEITLNAAKMSELINLAPKVIVEKRPLTGAN